MLSSSKSKDGETESRAWLQEKVYEPKRKRTLELVQQSVDALRKAGKRVSLDSIKEKSKELDQSGKGISESAILNNAEACSYYKDHRSWRGISSRRRVEPSIALNTSRLHIKIDRDENRARQRYLKLSKPELVERLLIVERAYAEQQEEWLRANDELLNRHLNKEKDESNSSAQIISLKEDDDKYQQPTSNELWDAKETGVPLEPPQLTALNNFDYFNKIEEAFVRRRGKHLYLSPVDWALMESWKEKGLPLQVILRGIDIVFDRRAAKPQSHSVKSLFYCQEEVEAQYDAWRKGQVGKSHSTNISPELKDSVSQEETHLPFLRATILQHLSRCRTTLREVNAERKSEDELSTMLNHIIDRLNELEEEFAQVAHPDAEGLEATLIYLEDLMAQAINASTSPEHIVVQRAKAKEQLDGHQYKMKPDAYELTLNNLLVKYLREEARLPRLSLFYL